MRHTWKIRLILAMVLMSIALLGFGTVAFAAEDSEDYTMGAGYHGDEYEEITLYGDSFDAPIYGEASSVGLDGKTYYHDARYNGRTVRRGIDVSKWQGDIDWKRIKSNGIEFAIIRVAFRSSEDGSLGTDEYAIRNIQEAKKAGLKIGAYIFSQAATVQEAEEEADYILNILDGYYLDLPIVMDYEFRDGPRGRLYDALKYDYSNEAERTQKKQQATDAINAFCNRIKSKGYTAMLYANVSMLNNYMFTPKVYNTNYIWVARYNDRVSTASITYSGKYDFWQYSGEINGYNYGTQSNSLDGDFWYDDGLSMALNRTGLFYQGDDLYYFRNGYIDYSYTGLEKCKDTWYYVKGGKVDYTYSGLFNNGVGWWYVEKGIVTFKYNGLCANQNGIWYVRNSQIIFDYSGLYEAKNTSINGKDGKSTTYSGWYNIVNGQVSNKEMLVQHNKDWWYCNGGKVDFSAHTLAKHGSDWWYVKGGKVDFGYTGIARKNGDWYVKGGKVQFNTTSVVQTLKTTMNGATFEGWYYVKDGLVTYNTITIAKNDYGLWYIGKDGKVDFSVNGLVDIGGTWWYLKGGKVDTAFKGIIRYNGGDWYVKDGKIQFGTTAVVEAQATEQDGVSFGGWYYVKDGMVVYNTTTVQQNEYGWWYIGKDGKVNFGFNGLAQNSNGWWYLSGGKVDFGYNGIARNEVGDWHIQGGKVLFGTKGLVESKKTDRGVDFNGWYYVEGGKVVYDKVLLVQNHQGWWYVGKDGKIDFSANTVAQYGADWWCVRNGKIDFNYKGIASNDNGKWYIENGKVNFGYNGSYTSGETTYKVVNGKVS